MDAIRKNMIVFGLGPAGTGKTYLAMAMAITAFKNNEVSRIILTRPAIEAGEKLGFLPGDLQSKVDPYLRPLYDALYQIMGAESFAKNMEKGLIEVAPLAYMRGRTLDNAYIISVSYTHLIVGALGILVMALGITGVLPFNIGNPYMFYGVMSAVFILFIVMGVVSMRNAKLFEKKAESENSLVDTLLKWSEELSLIHIWLPHLLRHRHLPWWSCRYFHPQ